MWSSRCPSPAAMGVGSGVDTEKLQDGSSSLHCEASRRTFALENCPDPQQTLYEQESNPCCWEPMCGRRYIPKMSRLVHTRSHPTCSSSAGIPPIPSKRWTLCPLPLDLGGQWWLLTQGQEKPGGFSVSITLMERLLSACSFSESSQHRAQATCWVHMPVSLSKVQLA